MIVKVQLSLFGSEPAPQMLIYNEDRSIVYEAEATPEILACMDGAAKKYFTAELVGTEILLGDETETQNW